MDTFNRVSCHVVGKVDHKIINSERKFLQHVCRPRNCCVICTIRSGRWRRIQGHMVFNSVATDYCNAVRACIRCIFVARIDPPRQTQNTSEQKRLIRSSAQILLTKIHSVASYLHDIQPNGTFESLPSRTPHGHMACAQYCM